MTSEVSETSAARLLDDAGYAVDSVRRIPEGLNHIIFDATLKDGSSIIARFEKKRDDPAHGPLSLEREAASYGIVKDEAGLPAPKVYGLHEQDGKRFLVVEKLPGMLWRDFLKTNGYSREAYLRSLRFLGEDFARLHNVRFESFGHILDRKRIEPPDVTDFIDWISISIGADIKRAEKLGSLTTEELRNVRKYFDRSLSQLAGKITVGNQRPVFVIYDTHPENFLVDENGKPNGYFDMEYPRAGPPELDFFGHNLRIFNMFRGSFEDARNAFFEGYESEGGTYDLQDPLNRRLSCVLTAALELSAVSMYFGLNEKPLDTWSEGFKRLLFGTINTDSVDHEGFADILRTYIKQPEELNLP